MTYSEWKKAQKDGNTKSTKSKDSENSVSSDNTVSSYKEWKSNLTKNNKRISDINELNNLVSSYQDSYNKTVSNFDNRFKKNEYRADTQDFSNSFSSYRKTQQQKADRIFSLVNQYKSDLGDEYTSNVKNMLTDTLKSYRAYSDIAQKDVDYFSNFKDKDEYDVYNLSDKDLQKEYDTNNEFANKVYNSIGGIVSSITKKDIPSTNRAKYVENEVERRKQVRDEEREIKYSGKTYSDVIKGYDKADEETKSWIDENKYNYMTIDELKAEKERLESEKKKNGSGIVNFIAAANSGQEKFLDAAEKGYDYEHKIEIVNSALLNKEAENISKIDSDTLALIDKYNSAKTKVKSSVVNSGNSNSGNNIANYNNEVSYDDEKERLDILSKLENKINPETGKNYTSEEIYHIAELRDYQISKENTEDIVKGAETLAEKYPLASALGSRVLYYGGGLTGAGEGAIQLVEKALGQRENINAYSQAFSSTRASNQIDTTIMENHDFNIGNIDLFDFGYQTVTSVADNLIRAGLSAGSGGLAGAMMSAEVFSQSIIDGKDKGYSDAKAITNSVLQAVVEGLTEKYSLEKILEAKDAKHIWSAVAKSFAAEGSEEVVSNWANRIIDVIQNGQYNEVSQQIASNMLSGMSETNAIVDALLNVVGDDLEAGLIGGLSGALMGGGVYVGEAENSLKNKAVKGYLNQKETKAYKNSLVAGDEVTQKLAEGTDSYQAYKEAYDKYQSDNSKENIKGLKKASKETAKNIKQNVDTKTKTTFNTVLYNELNSEGNTVTDDEYMSAQKWANGDMLTEYDRSNIENLGEEKVRGAIEKAYEQQREKAYEIKDNASSAVIEERENAYKDLLKEGAKIKTTKDKKGIVESVYLAVDDNTNNDVEVSPASKMYSDIKLLSELGSTDDTLNSINAVANESGADFNDLAIKNRMSILGQDVDLTSSVNYSNAEDYLKQTAKNRVVAQKTLETGLDISEVGKDVYKSLSKKARLNLRFADKLSKVFGNKVVVFVSTLVEDENGKKTYVVPDNIAEKINVAKGEQSPYGAYSGKDGAIYLDINGKGSQKDWYVYSLSHEYTHAIAQNASDKFEDLAAFVFKEMGYDNVERLIRKKQDTQHIDLATAREEVVADACEEMLLSDDFIDHFNNLYSENKGLAQKLLRMLKKTWLSLKTLVNSMDEAYLSEEAKLMRQSTNEAKKLFAQKYAEALKVASGNYQASETLGENKTSLQGRDFEEEIARYSLGDNYESVDNSKGELEIAYNNTDVMYSERTWETGGKDQMIQYLKDNGYSESDISDFVSAIDNRIEGLHALAEKYANLSFPQFLDHLNKDIVTDIRTGKRTIFSFVSNGDYPVNIDTMLNCKKRIQYGKVLSRLAKSGVLGKIRFQSEAIALVNKILAQNGFETACHACFVEARRQQLQAWAETIVIEYNERVDQVIKQYNKTHKDKLTEGYLFTDNGNAVSDDDLIYAIGKLSEEGKTEDGSVIMSKNEGGGSAKTVYDKAFNLISADPKIFAKKLKVSDLLTAEGIEQVKRFSPEIFSLVKSRYGAASPKIIQDFNAYQNEILDLSFTTISKMTGNSVKGNLDITRSVKQRFKKEFTEKAKEIVAKQYPEINNAKERKKMVTTVYNQMIARQSMREYLFSIGGARIQSFSDFMIENVLDYIQIFTDMTLQKLPMHGYTKEMACLRLFGMSGAKWNGSWIAHTEESLGKEMAGLLPYTEENAKHGITVEVDGTKYVIQFDDFERNQLAKKNKDLFPNGDFIQSIGYKDLVSLMLDPRYSANVGSITIGFSDLQIRAMLNSPLFRMVIPYHKSGMSPLFAHLMGVSKYNDYSDFQTTRVARVRNAKTGEVYEYKKNKDGHFVIIDGKEHKISVDTSFAFDEDLQRTGDAKTTADNYLAFCKAPKTITVNGIEVEYTLHPEFNGVNEKGEQVGYDFTQEDNYYKLLENFNTYDSLQEITKGKKVPAPQGVVSMAYAGESKSTTLTEAQLEQYRKDLESVGLYTEDEINKYVEKAKRNFTQIIEAELASRNAIAAELNPKEEFTYQTIENELLNNFSREGRMATNIADYLEGKEVVNKILGKNLTDKYSFNDRSKDANKISQLTPKGTYLQARDTEGNTLTESQQEYFKDSNNSVNYQSREFAKEIQKEFNTSESVDTIVSTLESMRDIFFSDEYDYQEKKELIKYSAETLAYSALKKETVNDNEIVEYLEKRFRSKRKNKLVNFEENGIRLTAEQKAEIKGNYSSLREYQSKLLKHGIVLNEKGETLNDVWGELNEDYPSIFKSDTSDVDMPYIFEQALNPERSRSEEEFKYAVDSFVERLTSWVEDNPPEVPSFGEFRVDYSDPNLSQRDILATALMNAAADEGDFKIIQKYQENISDANRYERKLQRNKERLRDSFKKKKGLTAEERKALVEENKELNEKIRRIDSQLLKLSSTSSLKGYVENERKLAEKKSNERSMAKTKLKQEIIRTSKWITYPTKSQTPCPDFLKEPISKVLRALGEGTNNKDLAIALGNLNLKIESLKEAQDGEDGFNGYLDLPIDFTKELASLSKQVADMSEYSADKAKAIKDLTPNQAQKFELAIKQLRHSAENVNKLHQNKVFESAIKAGESTMKFLDDIALKVSDKDSTSYKIIMNMKDKAGKFLAWENALPEYVFNRFGEGGKSIFEEFKDSQDELARKTKIILDFTESVDGWNAKNIKKWETEKHEVELENGNKLTLTTANIMSIFGLARREQGVQHLLGGGVHVVYGKNNGETSDSILTINDLQKINDILTDEQRDIVIKAQKFFQTTGKWGNEISQKRFLVDMNTEKTYFPIETSDTTRADKDPQKSQMDMFRLLNISATKPLTPGANNQLVIRSFFEVFANHTADMAKMSSFGMSLLDFMKWFNYSNKNTFVGSDQNTKIEVKGVRKSMNKAFGENKTAVNYCREFIRDINGRSGSTSITEGIWSKFVRNTKVASVAANLRVAFLQPTAYLRAVKILSPASLTKGLSGVKNLRTYMKLAEKYCPMAYWKSLGFYETDINRGLESMIKGEESAKDKVLEKAMLGAEYGDKITWAVLFKACCYEVSKNGLTIGSEENYKAAGKLMRDVIYQTQVVDSTLTRSQAMRSKSTAMKVITAFMSEPTLSYNILLDSYEKINIDSRKYGKKEAWNRNKKYVSRSLVTYAITAIAAAIVEGLFDSWRDDDDEKFFEKFPQNFLENLIGDVSVLNKIPIFKDGFSLAMKMFGIGYYKESGLDNQVLADINNAYEIIKDDGYTFYGKWVKPITRILSDLSGVPAFAALREVVSVWNNIAPAIWGDTAKIISYNRNTTSMANVYLDALESGKNIDRALKQFEDNEKVQSGDKTVEEVANTYLKAYIGTQYKEGNMSKDKATEYLEKYVGMSDNDIYWAFDRWDSDSETYSKYEDLIEAVENGNVSSVISKYVDNTELKDGENQAEKKKRVLTAMRQSIASEYKNKYKNMSNAERVKIQRKLIDAYVACGMTRQDALEKINDWTK